jgi:inositol transporter-like SP family MFS transporter
MGLTQVAWSLGPIITLVLALVLSPYGLLGIRIIFVQLFVVALVTWFLRQGLTESATWTAAHTASESGGEGELLGARRMRDLFSGYTLRALIFTAVVYMFWNLAAGTYGFFLPFFLKELGAQGQGGSVALQCLWFTTTLVFVVFVFMRFSDTRYRRLIWGIGAVCQILAFLLFVFYPLDGPQGANIVASIANILLFGIGAAIAGEPHYKTWSQEVFPTMLRTTAQGITFAFARFCLGIWSFLVPTIAAAGFSNVALILVIFLSISGVVGYLFMPNTAGKSLEEIEAENYGGPRAESAATSGG